MYKKLCCYCLKVSMTTDHVATGEWQCTHCGRDITHIPAVLYEDEFSKEYLTTLVSYKKEASV